MSAQSPKPTPLPSSRPAPASGVVAKGHKKSVLIVDPDAESRYLLAHWFSARYDVFEAHDGLEALTLARLMPTVALVICEVALPTVDGFKLAKLFKLDPKLKSVPLVFLTSRISPRDVARGIEAGARRYLFKPFVPDTICAQLTKMIEP